MGWGLPFVVTFTLGLTGVWLGVQRSRDMRAILPAFEKDSPQDMKRSGREGSESWAGGWAELCRNCPSAKSGSYPGD